MLRRLCLAALLVVLTGCGLEPPVVAGPSASGPAASPPATSGPAASGPAASPPATSPPATSGPAASARAALGALPVKGRAPRTGYDRDEFGPAWADVDRNGCDTRNDVLARDLTAIALKPGTRGCVVLTGTLRDPYTGKILVFQRGPSSADVQIDHVVALSNAWQTGAQQWPDAKRRQFANDPVNLLAVDGRVNQQKSDGDAATWLPPARAAWCSFGIRQTTVKARYGLWVTPAERDALRRLLARCP